MDTPRSSSRLRLAAGLVLSVVLIAGCGGTGPVGRGPVATVNGAEISRSDVEVLIEAQQELIEVGAARAREQVESGEVQFTLEDVDRSLDEQLAILRGTGVGTINSDTASRQVTEMVELELLRSVLDEMGGEVTEQHRAQARADLEEEIQSSGLNVDDVPSLIIDHYTELAAIDVALQDAIPAEVGEGLGIDPEEYEAALRATFEANGASYRQICIYETIYESQEAADEAFERLEGGEDMADVVADLAPDDPTTAERLSACQPLPAGTLVEYVGEPAFTAEGGDVFEPIEMPQAAADGSSAWIVAVVESVEVPTFDDVREQISQDFPDTTQAEIEQARSQYLDDMIASVAADADVTIDPRYGTWDPATGSVVPPEDPGVAPVPTDDFEADLELVEPTQ